MHHWTTIILAGGQSRRMGDSKALLKINDQPMVKRMTDMLRPYSAQMIIVANEHDLPKIKDIYGQGAQGDEGEKGDITILTDVPTFKGMGPLAGMFTGMRHTNDQWYFVTACDMPYLNEAYVQQLHHLVFSTERYRAFIPIQEEQFQPFAAVYQNEARLIQSQLGQNKKRWMEFFHEIKHPYLIQEEEWRAWTDVEQPFFNMNHPHEFEQAQKTLYNRNSF